MTTSQTRRFLTSLLLALSVLALIGTLCFTALDRTLASGQGMGLDTQAAVTGVVGADSPVCSAGVTRDCAQGQLTAETQGRQYAMAPIGTLAQRNAYISCTAPATEVSPALRVKLLGYASKALEGIQARVPAQTLTAGLVTMYKITKAQASKVYWCTKKAFGV